MRRLAALVTPLVILGVVILAKAEPPALATAACPVDMRLVEHDHYEAIERSCTDLRDGGKHCYAYRPGSNRLLGAKEHLRFCMDPYEAPNVRGATPLVSQSGEDGALWCKARGKRLCKEKEFETACEGADMTPWPYGWSADVESCNSAKPWRQFNAEVLRDGGAKAEAELARLWQGEGSGSRATCATREGVYDLVGNVEEWVTSAPTRPRRFDKTLIGGFWAKPWSGCRGANHAHETTFRFYETGFRCCADAR